MRVDEAKYADGYLMLKVLPADALRIARKFDPGEYELKRTANKRSISANAYLWVLCDEISKVLRDGTTKEDVYRDYIKQVGIRREYHLLPDEVEPFMRLWKRQGIGWVCEVIDYDQDGNHQMVYAYYGSSTYNTKQMSRLIDQIVNDCRTYGIETYDDARINNLIEEWERQREK